MRKLLVEPVYGYGWRDHEGNLIDTPNPFSIEIVGSTIDKKENVLMDVVAIVKETGHVFSKKWIRLTLRTLGPDGANYNAYVYVSKPALGSDTRASDPIFTGFAGLRSV